VLRFWSSRICWRTIVGGYLVSGHVSFWSRGGIIWTLPSIEWSGRHEGRAEGARGIWIGRRGKKGK
jgi:hypothetical protein